MVAALKIKKLQFIKYITSIIVSNKLNRLSIARALKTALLKEIEFWLS